MILINFKLYKEAWGERAIELAKICKEVSEETGVKIYPIVSPFDVYRVSTAAAVEVFCQNIDGVVEGAKTGKLAIDQAKAAGAIGAIINHSECPKKPGTIKKLLKNWPDDFISVVCIQNAGQAEKWAKNLKCDFVAYEPKNLIGNREKSVASENQAAIKRLVDHYKSTPLLIGAGVHSHQDVLAAKKLGVKGLLIATDVVRADNPESELLELAKAFKTIP